MANKTDVVKQVAEKLDLSVRQSKKIVDNVFETMIEMFDKEDILSISGFGKFYNVDKPEREARNPKNGESVRVPAKRVLRFKASKKLEKLN